MEIKLPWSNDRRTGSGGRSFLVSVEPAGFLSPGANLGCSGTFTGLGCFTVAWVYISHQPHVGTESRNYLGTLGRRFFGWSGARLGQIALVLFGCALDTVVQENLEALNANQATLGSANETLSACFGRVLDKLLFRGVEPRIGLGGLELENLRITGEILMTSSSEEVDSLSSSSVLPMCVAR